MGTRERNLPMGGRAFSFLPGAAVDWGIAVGRWDFSYAMGTGAVATIVCW